MSPEEFSTLIEAVIWIESRDNAFAMSKRGAKGVMQLMDATGIEWMRRLKMEGEYQPFDREQNEKIGRAYLKWLLDKSGDVQLTLAMWNWGIGNVRKTMRRHELKTYAQLRTYLPRETMEFVDNVLERKRELEGVDAA